MSDQKLRCALLYRLSAAGGQTVLAKYDHAAAYESHGGATNEALYGNKEQSYVDAVAAVISNDPPSALTESGTLGGFKVVQSDQHQVVYGADGDGVCLAVITGLSYPSRVAIQMLQETYGEVMNKFSSEVMAGGENALTKKCKSLLQTACQKYDDLSQVDKASSLLGKVDVVKSQMQTNISDMLKNTDKADSLAEKSDQLNEQASVFKKKSTDLRKQMAWKNLKMSLLLGGIVLIILVVILAPLIRRSKKNGKD